MTVQSYESCADAYIRRTASYDSFPGLLGEVASFAADIRSAGLTLEVGFGGGRDIRLFQAEGHRVVGVEMTESFARQLTGTCPRVVMADIRALPFRTESFGGIWCAAVVHHLFERDYPVALAELCRVTAHDGLLGISVKAGDSAHYVDDGTGRRWFTLISAERFASFVSDSGFSVDRIETRQVADTTWISVRARRP